MSARAGEIEPRAYVNTPVGVNFVIAGYAYTDGGLSTGRSGCLRAVTYYRAGFVDIRAAVFIVVGFFAGSLAGARYATHLSSVAVTRLSAIFLLAVAVKMLLGARG